MTDTTNKPAALEAVAWMYEIPDANVRQIYGDRRIWNEGWTETPLADLNKVNDIIAGLEARVAALEDRLSFWAKRKTIDEVFHGAEDDHEWKTATPERRIEMMGERKLKHDEEVLAARAALKGDEQ